MFENISVFLLGCVYIIIGMDVLAAVDPYGELDHVLGLTQEANLFVFGIVLILWPFFATYIFWKKH